jgi:hypothetical protein
MHERKVQVPKVREERGFTGEVAGAVVLGLVLEGEVVDGGEEPL